MLCLACATDPGNISYQDSSDCAFEHVCIMPYVKFPSKQVVITRSPVCPQSCNLIQSHGARWDFHAGHSTIDILHGIRSAGAQCPIQVLDLLPFIM